MPVGSFQLPDLTSPANIARFGEIAGVQPLAGLAAKKGFLHTLSKALTKAQPYLLAAQFAYGFYARSRARSEAKRDARDSTAVKIKDVQPIEANQTAKILYGVCATQGARTFIAVQKDKDSIPLPPSGVTEVGLIPFDQDHRGTSIEAHPNEFFLAQYVLSPGKIESIVGMQVDGRETDRPYNDNGLKAPVSFGHETPGTLAGGWLLPYETASAFAKAFAETERTDDSKYAGASYADMWAQMPDSHNGKYRVFRGRTPQPVWWCKGRLVDELSNNVRVSDQTTASGNNALVLLDYLTNAVVVTRGDKVERVILYGPGFVDRFVDLTSFQTYRDLCERALVDADAAPNMPPAAGDLPSNFPEGYRARYEQAVGDQAKLAVLNQYYRSVGRTAFAIPGSTLALKKALGKVRYGAYDGELDTSLDIRDALEQIIQPVPGAVVRETIGNRVSVVAPDWTASAASQSVFTLTDEHLAGPVTMTDPDAAARFNRYSVTYNSIEDNFHEKTETWGAGVEASESILATQDGGQRLEREERVAGIVAQDQAITLARSRCLVSRRSLYNGSYHMKKAGNRIIEVGDVFRLNSEQFGFGNNDALYLRMDKWQLDPNTLVVGWDAVEFRNTDYGPVLAALATETERASEPITTGAFLRAIGVPRIRIPTGDTVVLQVDLMGSTRTVSEWEFEGATRNTSKVPTLNAGEYSAATINTAEQQAALIRWRPTTAKNTLTVKADMGMCVLDVVVEIDVGTVAADAEDVDVVDIAPTSPMGAYRVYHNGFKATPTPTFAWEASPPRLLAPVDNTVRDVGLVSDGTKGVLRCTVTGVDSKSVAKSVERLVSLPYEPTDGTHQVDGEEKVF